MNRLSVRLVLSHLVVAFIGALTTYLVVRRLAPALFDENVRHGLGGGTGRPLGSGPGRGQGQIIRDVFASAVDRALVAGTLAGIVTAALVGAFAAYRLLRPLDRVRLATRRMAQGRYDERVPEPRERELAGLVTDVNRLGHALADTEAQRVRLLGEVAHEMRTPLTVIDGYVEGMIDGVIAAEPAELGQVSAEVRRLRRLADDLSSLSRAAERRLDLHPAEVDLAAVVGSAAGRLRPQAEDAGLTLDLDLPSPPGRRSSPGNDPPASLPGIADGDRLAQVVTNLVGNAIRATAPGGRITVRLLPGDPGDPSDPIRIEVQDTGEGLTERDLSLVFERFYRVSGRRHPDGGSGIGLTIAREIMRAHGGDLTAASLGPGSGATFTASLPREHHRLSARKNGPVAPGDGGH